MICAKQAAPHLPLYLIVHTGNDFDIALEQIALFRNRRPDARIAIVADHYRLNELTSAFRAGANGYFVNVITCDRFIRSLELVMMGETIFPPAFLSLILDANRPIWSGRGKRSKWRANPSREGKRDRAPALRRRR
jgi:two-component system nitrate/nitrite response regulator NarL